MNLGIYKPGQGYWVRVMSAVLATLLTVALAAWVYGQMQVVASRLPVSEYRIGMAADQPGAFAAGDTVELTSRPDSTGVAVPLGTATVAQTDSNEKKLVVIRDFKPAAAPDGAPPIDVKSAGVIRKAAPDAKPVALQSSNAVVDVPPIDPIILSGSVAAIIFVIGAVLAYWLVGLRPRTVEFLIATDFEMKKVNWSTPRDIMGHTWVVIGACFLLAAALWIVDQALVFAFTAIKLLPEVQSTK